MAAGWDVPKITTADNEVFDGHLIQENLTEGAATVRTRIPPLYRDIELDHPTIQHWVSGLVQAARTDDRSPQPAIVAGPSLLLLGPIGTGKTYASYAAIQALLVTGARVRWEFVTEAGFLGKMRPRPRVDSEEVFDQYAKAGVLVLDDLGASKDTEWAAEVMYRLFDHRCAWLKPTIITSNIPLVGAPGFAEAVGPRVASRLRSMCTTVAFKGEDRRHRP